MSTLLVPAARNVEKSQLRREAGKLLREELEKVGGACTAESGHEFLKDLGLLNPADRNIARRNVGISSSPGQSNKHPWIWFINEKQLP
jgi:hypothetical protein